MTSRTQYYITNYQFLKVLSVLTQSCRTPTVCSTKHLQSCRIPSFFFKTLSMLTTCFSGLGPKRSGTL